MFALLRSAKKLKDLEERVDKLERASKGLLLDWEDTYDKIRRLMFRISKRVQRDEQLSPESGSIDAEPETLPPGAPGNLNARQSTIQQKILARRRAGGVM